MKIDLKADGGYGFDAAIPNQLKLNEDGTVSSAGVVNPETITDETLLPWGFLKKLRNLPLFFQGIHHGDRSSLARVFNGLAIANDGDQVSALTHPDVVLGILNNDQANCTEEEWQADPYKRGMWSRGNATVIDGVPYGWVRMPDMNQAKTGSLPAPFLRGGSDALVGKTEQDQMRNITGGQSFLASAMYEGTGQGAFFNAPMSTDYSVQGVSTPGLTRHSYLAFDASRVVPTGSENRPWTLRGVSYSIIANGVQNEAGINAAGLSAALDIAKAKIAMLEGRPRALGDGDTRVDVTSQRSIGVTYTNTSGRTKMAYIKGVSTTVNGYLGVTVNGESTLQYIPANNWGGSAFALILPGQTYSYGIYGATLGAILETQ